MATETTQALLDRLKRHYIKTGTDLPGGVFVPEVGQNGGWGAGSRCDAIFVGFTSTSGRIPLGSRKATIPWPIIIDTTA